MPFYVWWAIPLLATALAVAFLSWRSRERRIDPHDSVAARRRFEDALREPPETRNRRRQGRPGEVKDDVHAEPSANAEPNGRANDSANDSANDGVNDGADGPANGRWPESPEQRRGTTA